MYIAELQGDEYLGMKESESKKPKHIQNIMQAFRAIIVTVRDKIIRG